ncbi:MAG: nucleoside-diphosphate sugar epimerase/dehydratase, partial [Campylobacterota bacterium]|nr:nucleoside-diphosphate sugar epimerase/dehydratase [Campylobacterota bacterium]
FNFDIEQQYLESFFLVFLILISFKLGVMGYFNMYHISWRFVSLSDVKRLFYAHMLAYGLFVGVFYLSPDLFSPFPRSVLMIDFFFSMVFLGTLRIAKRLMIESRGDTNLAKTLLIGVSPFAQTLLKQQNDFYITAVVDDDEMIVESYFSNLHVHKLEDIEMLVKKDSIQSVIIAKRLDQSLLKSLYRRLNALHLYDIKVVSLEKKEEKLKKVTVEDLLARHPKDLDLETIASFVKDKSILITGAGGSIGSEIVRQCKRFGASRLTLVDNSEFNLYQIGQQVEEAALKLLSVTDLQKLDTLFKSVKPQIVIHAAAYKHVPMCEENPEAAVENNVLGTKNVIDSSIEHGVQKLVIISTDKAVRPTNVMGATKRVTELYANNVDEKETEIVAVRFGNVLGSSGSVIPKFKKQIEEGGPLSVTHPDITRYFMLIPEACQLVLQAASIAKGGELFILDMGEPIKIVDLAQQMIRLYGKEDDIEIEFTGLRPGEKLYEELLLDESEQETKYQSIFIAKPTPYVMEELSHDIESLFLADDKIKALQKIVPEFQQQSKI